MINLEHPIAIKIRKSIVRALADYEMLEEGDRLLVCVSGGKDSSILLSLLKDIQVRAPYNFHFEAVLLDQKQPGFAATEFQEWVLSQDIKLTVLERDTYSIVVEKVQGKTYCSLCSRLRRGILYNFAFDQGFTKIALGHHSDDMMETLLLNLFYQGRLGTMPPKLLSDDGRNVLIRPMTYVHEDDVVQLAKDWMIPIIPCNLCGSQEGLKRKRIKQLITKLQAEIPDIHLSMLNAMGNVRRSQLLDRELWDFSNLQSLPKESVD